MPETTFVSPPPPPHEQSSLSSPDQLAGGSPRSNVNGAFSGSAGRLSVLPPLTRRRSPPGARPSSPRRHASFSSYSSTTQAQPQRTTTRHPLPLPHFFPPRRSYSHHSRPHSPSPNRNDRRTNTTSATEDMPESWGEDTVSRHTFMSSYDNPYDGYLPESNPTTESTSHPTSARLPPPRALNPTESLEAPLARSRPSFAPRVLPPPPAGPSRSETQLTGSTWNDSLPTQHDEGSLFVDDDEDDLGLYPGLDSSQTSFSESMPATRKRNPPSREDSHAAKRPRAAGSVKEEVSASRRNSIPPTTAEDLDELFGESPPGQHNGGPEEFPTIDLTEVNEVPEELKKPEDDKRVKLSAFQCVICMDDVTTLTVTHCGHLYCAQCLHSSLHVEATKGKCPMCRSKIDMRSRDSYVTKTKGYWPLELKLMTTTRKGKRKADADT